MQGLKELIALSIATGCLFTSAEEAPDHIRTLLQFNIIPQSGAGPTEIADALRDILREGIDADSWNSFGCEFTGPQWTAILAEVAADYDVTLP